MRFTKKHVAIAGLGAALVVAIGLAVMPKPKQAEAQGVYYTASGTSAAGQIVPVFNAIDSVITDGTVVSIDTTASTSTNLDRIVVRPYNGTVLNRNRVIGLAVGPIRRLGPGNVLIWGYHPNAKMAASGLTANTAIKVAALHGSLNTVVDTLGIQCGIFIGYNSNSTAANNRGKVFITGGINKMVTAL